MKLALTKATKFFLCLSLLSPLLVTRTLFFPFITGKALFFRTSVELALLCFTWLSISYSLNFKKLKHPLFIAVAIFTILLVATSLASDNPQVSFWSNFERAEGAWQVIHYFLFFTLTMLLFESKKDWVNLLRYHTVITFLISLYALAQFLNIKAGKLIVAPGPISGTLGNSSYLSIVLIFSLFFIIWLIFEEKNRLIKILWSLVGGFNLFMIFQAKTRATFLAVAMGLAATLPLLAWQIHKKHKEKLSKKAITICYLTAILTVLIIVSGSVMLVINVRGDVYQALLPRFWTWGSAFAGFLEKPFLGWGMENFPNAFDKYYNANHYTVESWFDRTHNIFLEYLISGGMVLLLAYLTIFYFLYRQLFSIQIKERNYFWPVLFSMPTIYLINGLTLFEVLPIYINLFLFLAFFINYKNQFAITAVSHSTLLGTKPIIKWSAKYASLILIGLSIYATIYLPLIKNRLLIKAVIIGKKTPQEVFKDFEVALNFYSPIGQFELDQQLFTLSAEFFNWLKEKDLISPDQKKNVEAIANFNHEWFVKDRGNYVGVKNSYVIIEMLLKAFLLTDNQDLLDKAKQVVEEGLKIAPTRVELLMQRLKIAEIEKDSKKNNEIKSFINKLRPDLKI